MPEILQEQDRKANRPHACSYCGCTIEKGEVYEWAKLKFEGRIYEWKNHKKCGYIASQLWEYADPDDGMTEDDFTDACRNFCRTFICPDCRMADKETYDELECKDDRIFCTDKIYDFLQTHEFYKERRDGWAEVWKCRERKERTENGNDAGIAF